MYLFIIVCITIVILICLSFVNFSDNYSTCLYDTLSQKSYIYVDNKDSIQNIQNSLNNQDNIYYIKNNNLYHYNKIIKKLLLCNKYNIEFMNKKYNVKLLS